jgi:hypothetical protein
MAKPGYGRPTGRFQAEQMTVPDPKYLLNRKRLDRRETEVLLDLVRQKHIAPIPVTPMPLAEANHGDTIGRARRADAVSWWRDSGQEAL